MVCIFKKDTTIRLCRKVYMYIYPKLLIQDTIHGYEDGQQSGHNYDLSQPVECALHSLLCSG